MESLTAKTITLLTTSFSFEMLSLAFFHFNILID